MTRPVVYVCGPYTAPNAWIQEGNVRAAETACFGLVREGFAAICPHTTSRFFAGTLTEEEWMEACLALLAKADAVFLVPGWDGSNGSLREVELANKLGIVCHGTFKMMRLWRETVWRESK